jgi:hypothetical protein
MKHRAWLAVIALATASCTKDDPVGTYGGITRVSLNVGGFSKYAWHFEVRDSLGNILTAERDTIVARVAGVNETAGNDSGLIRVQAFSAVRYTGTVNVWYKESKDSLTEVAYSNAGLVPIALPRRETAALLHLSSLSVNSLFFPK